MSLQARYTILRKIADGGTAEIFLATQRGVHGFEKVVVLKRIFPAFYADPQFRDMLVNEAHIAMSFNHSNIVQVLDLGEDDGQYILALELVDGWTLDTVIRRVRAARSSFPPAMALYVTAQVCRALAYAHAKTDAEGKPLGIVHRDISPHNVLLSEQGEVKLTDFGIATLKEKNEQGGEKVIRGKIAFMSPEQAAGGPLDSRSDLFSVGTMLYVMICGRYPFDAPTDLEVLLLVKSGEAVPPEVARPGIHPEVARLLKRALAKDAAERFQHADDMLLEVEQVMRGAFRAVGQTELKRWLQDLSARDGVPPLTKAPALPSSTPAGRVVGPATPAAATPLKIPRPPAQARSASVMRPPPPPAALSVGRRAGAPGASPPRGRPPAAAVRPAEDEDAPILDAPTPLPEVQSGPIPLSPETPEPPSSVAIPADPASVSSPVASGATESSPSSPGESAPIPLSMAASLSARLNQGPRPTGSVPVPTFPQGPVVPAPPVAPEILAAVGGNESKTRTAPSAGSLPSSPATATPAARRTVVWLGAGLGALAIVIGSVKACGTHRRAPVAREEKAAAVPAGTDVRNQEAKSPTAAPPMANTDAAAPLVAEPANAATPAGAGGAAVAEPAAVVAGGGGSPVIAAEPTVPRAVGQPEAAAPEEASPDAGPAPDATHVAEGEPAAASPVAPSEASPREGAADAGETSPSAEEIVKVTVTITSVPPGAHLTTAHHDYGTTPARIRLRAGNAYALTFKLDGYRPVTKHIEVTADPDQEFAATLRKTGTAAPVREAPTVGPAPAAPVSTPAPRPAAPTKPGKSWWQKMFSR